MTFVTTFHLQESDKFYFNQNAQFPIAYLEILNEFMPPKVQDSREDERVRGALIPDDRKREENNRLVKIKDLPEVLNFISRSFSSVLENVLEKIDQNRPCIRRIEVLTC